MLNKKQRDSERKNHLVFIQLKLCSFLITMFLYVKRVNSDKRFAHANSSINSVLNILYNEGQKWLFKMTAMIQNYTNS